MSVLLVKNHSSTSPEIGYTQPETYEAKIATENRTSFFISQMKIHIIIGARPNFMKAAPLYHALCKIDQIEVDLIHTGQHYDKNLSDDILTDLNLPTPTRNLNVGSGSHAVQTAKIMIGYEELCLEDRPDLVIVVGDVNSTIACALTAKKLGLNVAHLEAGLRSRDMGMPEEINRILTDQLSDVLWTPSRDGNQNLLREGIDESKISFVGNLMIDTLVNLSPQIDTIDIRSFFPEIPEEYGLITLHRPSNVDNPVVLEKIIKKIQELSLKYDIMMVFPVHPRTRCKLNHEGIAKIFRDSNCFILLDPVPYLRFMALVKSSRFLITDSGGIQEETTFLGIPCFTLRPNTERPITISEGSNILVTPDNLLEKVEHSLAAKRPEHKVPDYWDGKSAERVVKDIIFRYHSKN